ncbi:MAG: ArsR family transcriptional regulator [Candidatus Marinimicrobia bacterium]|nr:ArsR family transcriptional regulator [Candidatus Neomarinimicrobiota bacterium]
MLDSLITSKARLKLLLKFFINPETRAYLRELAKEFGESTNNIRVELNRLTKAKLLVSENAGRTILYKANIEHTLFTDIQNVVKKYVGIDRLVDDLVSQLGQLEAAYIIGDYARGVDSGLIDLVLVGKVKQDVLQRLVEKTGAVISRKIRPLVVDQDEFNRLQDQLDIKHALLVWGNNSTLSAKNP